LETIPSGAKKTETIVFLRERRFTQKIWPEQVADLFERLLDHVWHGLGEQVEDNQGIYRGILGRAGPQPAGKRHVDCVQVAVDLLEPAQVAVHLRALFMAEVGLAWCRLRFSPHF
jgi:hypothetical protein